MIPITTVSLIPSLLYVLAGVDTLAMSSSMGFEYRQALDALEAVQKHAFALKKGRQVDLPICSLLCGWKQGTPERGEDRRGSHWLQMRNRESKVPISEVNRRSRGLLEVSAVLPLLYPFR